MTSKLNAITCKSPASYQIELEVVGTGEKLNFEFMVDDTSGIEVVTWSREFELYVCCNFGPLAPLMDAILRFHQAQKIEIS